METTASDVSDLLPAAAAPRKHRRIRSEVNPHDPITKLVDDLLVEILIRLPNPRSTCRGKSVCKRWNSLISDPCFNRRLLSHHRSRTEPPSLFLPSYDTQSVISSFLPVPDEELIGCRRLAIWDCNKELVLCGYPDIGGRNCELGRTYLVCNPFTKQWIALPLAPEKTIGYASPTARLVCQPRIVHNLELGDGQAYVHCSEYRFRLVCIYEYPLETTIMGDVFCSESGKWYKEALLLDDGGFGLYHPNLLSWDEEMWCAYSKPGFCGGNPVIVSFNPFRTDLPPAFHLEASAIFRRTFNLNLTQGALHTIVIDEPTPGWSTVWRLEDDRKSWKKQYEGLFKTSSGNSGSPEKGCVVQLHPEKLEIVFLRKNSGVYFSDLSKGDLEFLYDLKLGVPCWRGYQLRVCCWPTQITRYEELRGAYDGSYSCWVQQSSKKQSFPPPLDAN